VNLKSFISSGDEVRIPAAIQEMVLRFFGEATLPDYSSTPDILARDPYRKVRNSLSSRFDLVEFTDVNVDLGIVLALGNHKDQATVRLSVVGPFALITNSAGQVILPRDLTRLLRDEGFQFLDRKTLELPVPYWSPEVEVYLYECIFEFDEGFPWAR
jgi:hypothetical protein